jgi:hypothetical protein
MKATTKLVAFAGWNALLFPEAADIQAMTDAGRRSVITCRNNPFIHDQNCPDEPSGTSGTLSYQFSYRHEIFMP